MDMLRQLLRTVASEIKLFTRELYVYVVKMLRLQFVHFELGKDVFVTALYRQRGRLAKRLMHSGMAGIAAFGVMVAPMIAEQLPASAIDPWEDTSTQSVLSASTDQFTATIISDKDYRDRIVEYTVEQGDTVGTISEKFGVSEDTVRWENDLTKDTIKVGQTLKILPVTGVAHTVKKGDTVYSIAKKYDTDAQQIVNYPFNTFVNDESFELAIGQTLVVPEGIFPEPVNSFSPVARTPRIDRITPDAGSVTASGSFVWPSQGSITSNFVWYHKGIDIANRAAPNILAADAGTVTIAGWPDNWGYGNRVVIDHGNGFRTLYAHLSAIYVVPGQTVSRGAAIGRMGSTGRSTGTHLHFEVIKNGTHINPFTVLQ